jgi:hypothetical protein
VIDVFGDTYNIDNSAKYITVEELDNTFAEIWSILVQMLTLVG